MIRINENINGVIDIYEKDQLIDQIIPDYDLDKSIDLLKNLTTLKFITKKFIKFGNQKNYYILQAYKNGFFGITLFL